MLYTEIMKKSQIIAIVRMTFAIATAAAIGTQLAKLQAYGVLNPVNFLSYFTNLSNIFAAVILFTSGLRLYKGLRPTRSDDVIRLAAVLYMAVTGIVYSTLLTGTDVGLLIPWVNILMHYIMPIVVVADWLYQPQKAKLGINDAKWWLLFPVSYLLYSLIRGSIVNWYPYPFLNPDKVGGYDGVFVYCAVILLAFLGFSWVLVTLGNRLKRHV